MSNTLAGLLSIQAATDEALAELQEMVEEQVVNPKGIEQVVGLADIFPEGTGVGVGVLVFVGVGVLVLVGVLVFVGVGVLVFVGVGVFVEVAVGVLVLVGVGAGFASTNTVSSVTILPPLAGAPFK